MVFPAEMFLAWRTSLPAPHSDFHERPSRWSPTQGLLVPQLAGYPMETAIAVSRPVFLRRLGAQSIEPLPGARRGVRPVVGDVVEDLCHVPSAPAVTDDSIGIKEIHLPDGRPRIADRLHLEAERAQGPAQERPHRIVVLHDQDAPRGDRRHGTIFASHAAQRMPDTD